MCNSQDLLQAGEQTYLDRNSITVSAHSTDLMWQSRIQFLYSCSFFHWLQPGLLRLLLLLLLLLFDKLQ